MTLTGEKLARRPKWVMPLLLVLLVVLVIGYVLYRQWTAVPTLFRDADARLRAIPEPERLELARQIEMRLPGQVSGRIEPGTDGRRTLVATFEELNAWLNLRLEPYLKNQGIDWPQGVGAVLVAERAGELVLAADVDLPQLRQIVSVSFELIDLSPTDGSTEPGSEADAAPESEDGPHWAIRVSGVKAGNVPLPRGQLAELIRDQLGSAGGEAPEEGAVAELLDALENDRAVPIPSLRVDAVRRAAVTDLAVTPVGLTGTLRVWREAGEPKR
ncbi:MAG: hypothetical protein AAF916_08380 [Planctomycetota bacterium]